MKNYPQIAQKLYGEPWLITRDVHQRFQKIFEARLAGNLAEIPTEQKEEPGEWEPRLIGSVQVIPVFGVLGKHLSLFEMMCGGCDVDEIAKATRAADADPRVETILFEFRTPGGTVTGIPECGRVIADCSKDTVAFTDEQCCSGGLWLAMECDKFYCTESAVIGSCGVYQFFMDYSQQLADEGVKANPISSGEFKLAGASFKPMTDPERAMFQAGCDRIHAKFKDVVNARRSVEDRFLQGQCFDGDEAEGVGMVDGLVDSMDELLEELQ